MRPSQQVMLQVAEQEPCPTDREEPVLRPDGDMLFAEPGNLALDELLVLGIDRG
jgi:hypothetical protein